ncbi:MAG TPA: hypothetical protein VK473_09200 [Terriglobales bacterium]|nr:hypothetical protein [Terriglobales bacterium]
MRSVPLTLCLLALSFLVLDCAAQDLPRQHAFFDAKNISLFAAVAGTRLLDVHSTSRCLHNRYYETQLPPSLVANKPAFVGYSFALAGLHMEAAYILHRSHHHKLERAISIVHIGAITATAARNYSIP